jgi:hypothetical protein
VTVVLVQYTFVLGARYPTPACIQVVHKRAPTSAVSALPVRGIAGRLPALKHYEDDLKGTAHDFEELTVA